MRTPPPGKNHLAFETSPYLLQHADNPVDWYPWGEEALAKARSEGKPVLVSIGYSSCHWCHVMEHESFEDSATARLMNDLFVCVKVDREERPDVDEIYMTAVQMMGVPGGWPLNVFLTPDGRPFFGGTYFPPDRRWGRASWADVLAQVAAAWKDQREKVVEQGGRLVDALRKEAPGAAGSSVPDGRLLTTAVDGLLARFDPTWGGFGDAPKFPPSLALELLLRRFADGGDPQHLLVVERTLERMAAGGMYDQLGGGFHRYSVDEQWLVPHFEKMLYDNALLARVYVEAWQVTGQDEYARVARETLDWVLREMTEPAGGFRSATDADSEGREGRYFVWTKPELEERLGADAVLFCDVYGVTEKGNFEDPHHPRGRGEPGVNVLHVARPLAEVAAARGLDLAAAEASLARSRKALLEARSERASPGLDDKVITSWNALMIGTMAYAGRALEEPRYVEAARQAGEFVRTRMRTNEGRLLRTARGGEAKIPAFLEDHAYLVNALLDLYEATFELRWFREATSTARAMHSLFADEAGGWFHTATDGDPLVARPQSAFDSSLPSANGAAAIACARLAAFTGEARWRERADAALRRFSPMMERAPGGTITLLLALDDVLHPGGEVAFVGKPDDAATRALVLPVRHAFLPRTVVALLDPSGAERAEAEKMVPLLEGKKLVGGAPAAYVCREFACRAPVTSAAEVAKAIEGL